MDTIAPSLSPLRLFGGGDGDDGSPFSSSAAAANTAVVAPGVAFFDLSSSPSIAAAASVRPVSGYLGSLGLGSGFGLVGSGSSVG